MSSSSGEHTEVKLRGNSAEQDPREKGSEIVANDKAERCLFPWD